MRPRDRPGSTSALMVRSVKTSLGIISKSAVALSCGKKEYLNHQQAGLSGTLMKLLAHQIQLWLFSLSAGAGCTVVWQKGVAGCLWAHLLPVLTLKGTEVLSSSAQHEPAFDLCQEPSSKTQTDVAAC